MEGEGKRRVGVVRCCRLFGEKSSLELSCAMTLLNHKLSSSQDVTRQTHFRFCSTADSFLTSTTTQSTTMSVQTSTNPNFTPQQQHAPVPPPANLPTSIPNPTDTNEEWSEEQLLANLRKLDELHRKVQLPRSPLSTLAYTSLLSK